MYLWDVQNVCKMIPVFMDMKFAESQESLLDANKAVKLVSDMYEKIHNAANLDQL